MRSQPAAAQAFIKLQAGVAGLTLDALQAVLKEGVGRHEMIVAIELRAELPKAAVGKRSKNDLVDDEARRRSSIAAA